MSKKKAAGHHGGSWKVAFADFMTAMFALFLVLWLVGLKPEQKMGIETYFKTYTIFQNKQMSNTEGSNSIIKDLKNSGKAKETSVDKNKLEIKKKTPEKNEDKKKKLVDTLKLLLQEELKNNKNQIIIEETPNGVRIEMFDEKGKPLFELGSPKPTETAYTILREISKVIANNDFSVSLEGHTDSRKYSSIEYTNWELSTERALAARLELQKDGIKPERINSITGYAESRPLIKTDPSDIRNRRISLLVDVAGSQRGSTVTFSGIGSENILITPEKVVPEATGSTGHSTQGETTAPASHSTPTEHSAPSGH